MHEIAGYSLPGYRRTGMYKNFRVGKIKFFQPKVEAAPPYILVDCIECCVDKDGMEYWATYNMWVETDKFLEVRRSSVGQWILFGFYIQAFRINDRSYSNSLKLRHYDVIPGEEVATLTIKQGDKLKLVELPNEAKALAHEISNQTNFNEHGKR